MKTNKLICKKTKDKINKIKEVITIKTEINGLNINYIEKGVGENVLIIPGWGTNYNVYKNMIENISTYAKVFYFDMPGFGESEEPKEAMSVDDFVDLVKEFIKQNNIDNVTLIGHSNGGRIIIKMISEGKLDFKVRRAILIGSAGIVHKKTAKQKMKLSIVKFGKKVLSFSIIKKIFPNALENLKKKMGSVDYRNATPVMRNTLVKLVNEDLKDCLPKVNVPTLLLWGENDTETPLADAKIMEKAIPDAGLVTCKNCSHYVFLERPAQINNIINNFITGGNNK